MHSGASFNKRIMISPYLPWISSDHWLQYQEWGEMKLQHIRVNFMRACLIVRLKRLKAEKPDTFTPVNYYCNLQIFDNLLSCFTWGNCALCCNYGWHVGSRMNLNQVFFFRSNLRQDTGTVLQTIQRNVNPYLCGGYGKGRRSRSHKHAKSMLNPPAAERSCLVPVGCTSRSQP